MPLIRRGGGRSPPVEDNGSDPERLLRDGTSDQRWAAARSLAGQPQAVDALGGALSTESDARVREAILTGLARIGTPASAEAIVPLIRSEKADVRTAALDALRLMPRALEAHLTTLLKDAEPDVRVLACDLARELPPPVATRLLCALLAHDAEANACAAAVEVLAECGEASALQALAACAERFADVPFLVFSANIASERIRAQAPARDG